VLRACKEKYQGYLKELEESGQTQLLLTDPEARRMHSKDGFHCCYNVQTAVDGGSHLVAEFEVTNHNTDQGLLKEIADSTRTLLETETIEVVADKGYESRKIFKSAYRQACCQNAYEDTAIGVELKEQTVISCFSLNEDGTVTCPMGQALQAGYSAYQGRL